LTALGRAPAFFVGRLDKKSGFFLALHIYSDDKQTNFATGFLIAAWYEHVPQRVDRTPRRCRKPAARDND
jgi:hypothetical protein